MVFEQILQGREKHSFNIAFFFSTLLFYFHPPPPLFFFSPASPPVKRGSFHPGRKSRQNTFSQSLTGKTKTLIYVNQSPGRTMKYEDNQNRTRQFHWSKRAKDIHNGKTQPSLGVCPRVLLEPWLLPDVALLSTETMLNFHISPSSSVETYRLPKQSGQVSQGWLCNASPGIPWL